MTEYAIRYPRRVLVRSVLRALGRLLLRVFARPEINGLENLPKDGPLILVGNHVALIEALMMVLYVPWPVEILASADIPLDPRFAWTSKLWGFIPVDRGSVDRKEMEVPLDVLRQGGVVGIFPEGGIWSTSMKRARTGVAWLSFHASAPVLPMGFGGMRGALQAAMQLKRPRVVMNVGKPLPPVTHQAGLSRKAALEQAAQAIMAEVEALVPAEEKADWNRIQDEQFDFTLTCHSATGTTEQTVAHPRGLGRFFHTPVILDVMARNMRLPVQPLQRFDQVQDAAALVPALDHALAFFDSHPQFLSYRFGYEEAAEIYNGVVELRDLARAAAEQGQRLKLNPVRRYRDTHLSRDVVETLPRGMHAL
jgi:1-acyl-sn-glycerol-3-phosphate acyltransferase